MNKSFLGFASLLGLLSVHPTSKANHRTEVRSFKLRTKAERESGYLELIESRKAQRRTNFTKSPSQIRFAQRNYEIRMAKKTIAAYL